MNDVENHGSIWGFMVFHQIFGHFQRQILFWKVRSVNDLPQVPHGRNKIPVFLQITMEGSPKSQLWWRRGN